MYWHHKICSLVMPQTLGQLGSQEKTQTAALVKRSRGSSWFDIVWIMQINYRTKSGMEKCLFNFLGGKIVKLRILLVNFYHQVVHCINLYRLHFVCFSYLDNGGFEKSFSRLPEILQWALPFLGNLINSLCSRDYFRDKILQRFS